MSTSSLITFTSDLITAARASGKLEAARSYTKTLRPLRLYCECIAPGVDPSIFSLIDPTFVSGFEAFLLNDYPAHLDSGTISPATVAKHMRNLRLIARVAITDYAALPNIGPDDLPELKTLADTTPDDLQLIVRTFAVLDEKVAADRFATKAEAQLVRLQHRTLGLLITSVLLAGIGTDGLFSLRRRHLNGDILTLPHLSVTIDLSSRDSGISLLCMLVHRFADTEATDPAAPLFPHRPEEADKKLAALQHNIHQLLQAIGITRTERFAHAFASWITIAQSLTSFTRYIRPFIDAYLRHPQQPEPSYQHLINTVAAPYASISRQWYAIKCVGISGDDLAQRIIADNHLTTNQIYIPRHELVKEIKGHRVTFNNPVINRTLFVRTTLRQADALQRTYRTLGIFYATPDDAGRRAYTVIPDRQLTSFRRFLGVPDAELITLDPTLHYPGARVRITGGPFVGCEGVISEIKMSHGQAPAPRPPKGGGAAGAMAETAEAPTVKCFVIKIEGLCAFGTLDIDPSLLEYQGG